MPLSGDAAAVAGAGVLTAGAADTGAALAGCATAGKETKLAVAIVAIVTVQKIKFFKTHPLEFKYLSAKEYLKFHKTRSASDERIFL